MSFRKIFGFDAAGTGLSPNWQKSGYGSEAGGAGAGGGGHVGVSSHHSVPILAVKQKARPSAVSEDVEGEIGTHTRISEQTQD